MEKGWGSHSLNWNGIYFNWNGVMFGFLFLVVDVRGHWPYLHLCCSLFSNRIMAYQTQQLIRTRQQWGSISSTQDDVARFQGVLQRRGSNVTDRFGDSE